MDPLKKVYIKHMSKIHNAAVKVFYGIYGRCHVDPNPLYGSLTRSVDEILDVCKQFMSREEKKLYFINETCIFVEVQA